MNHTVKTIQRKKRICIFFRPKPDDYSEDDDVQYVNMEEEVVDIYYEETDAPEEISVNQEQNRLKSFTDLEENDQMYLVSQKCLLELADHIRLQNCSVKGCNEMIAIDVKSNGSGAILRWVIIFVRILV